MMNRSLSFARPLTLGALLALGLPLTGQDWPNWRGPNHDGSAPASNLPVTFDQETNVRWRLDLPGVGASTPIVLGDRVFLSSVDADDSHLLALCVDRNSGEILWSQDAGSGWMGENYDSAVRKDPRSTYAAPSPVTDGERVVFFFGNGDLVSYTLDGEEQWRRNLQEDYGTFAFQWTFSTSPTLHEGKLWLPVLQRDIPVPRRAWGSRGRGGQRGQRGQGLQRGQGGQRGQRRQGGQRQRGEPRPETSQPLGDIESYVLGIDPATGESLFKHTRLSPAKMESREAYTTMVPYEGADGRKEMLLVGGDVISGHDLDTGEELWRWGTWNEGHRQRAWRLVPTPVVADDLALICAPKNAPVFAVQLGGTGAQGDEALVWQSEGRPNPVTTDVPTPAHHNGYFYVLSDMRNAMSKVEATSGEVAWTVDLPKDFRWRASPTVADGKIWIMNHGGEVMVLSTEDGGVLHKVAMGGEEDDQIRSCVVVAHDNLFIRTNDALFCIGQEQ